jgi:selenide,water dikinase
MEWKGAERLYRGLHADDDAVVLQMPDGRLVAATVDVFTPVVDDPYLYGQVAAANSLSDIYAMGGEPRLALSVLGYPPDLFGPETPHRIIQGAIDKCWEAGAVLGGGHTVKTTEVLFGLSVMGDFPEGRVLEKGGARPGDLLVLTKPLGVGVLTTAIKRQRLSTEGIDRVVAQMAALNGPASRIAVATGVVCCTDVTGFGMLGHLCEMVDASPGVGVRIEAASVPLLPESRELAAEGLIPGGSRANLKFVTPKVDFAPSVDEISRILLADAQTSGGLLIAVPKAALPDFQSRCADAGQLQAVIGTFVPGDGRVTVV